MLKINWRLQNLQYFKNYYKSAIDGVEGKYAREAYTNFQKDYGLKVDGVYGIETDTKLVSVIKEIQTKLNQFGNYGLSIDGEFGTKTIKAMKDFQKRNGLATDGIYGKNTDAKFKQLFDNKYMTDEDWKNSKYFKKNEFKCPCGKCNEYGEGIYKSLVSDMNELRGHYSKPVMISSGYRCPEFNATLKGSIPDSPHTTGQACDFYITGFTNNQSNRINIMNHLKTLPNFKHTYCNINGNHPNMGNAIHIDTL